MSEPRPRRRFLAAYVVLIGAVMGYALAEGIATAYYRLTWKGTSLFLFDESGKTIHFDPIRGYRLTSQPSRWARITNGTLEYVGELKGNSQGFPTRVDFGPQRPRGNALRIGVFGDSFSAGEYLKTNWPDRVQTLESGNEGKLQLLNFSVDGAGLANWWSILTRLVQPEHYDLDELVFVVFSANLERKFVVAEHAGYRRHMFGRCDSWDPSTYPTSLAQARGCMEEVKGVYIVSDDDFQGALNGRWPASVPRPPLRPVLAARMAGLIKTAVEPKLTLAAPSAFTRFDPAQMKLIEDIHHFISDRNVPALVVFLPQRDEIVQGTWSADPWRDETIAFAKSIGAEYRDGALAFANMTAAEIRRSFLPYDYHWNQNGSDRFAMFMLDQIQASMGKARASAGRANVP